METCSDGSVTTERPPSWRLPSGPSRSPAGLGRWAAADVLITALATRRPARRPLAV